MATILPLQHLAELASVFSLLDFTHDSSQTVATRQVALLNADYYASVSERILTRIAHYYKDHLIDSLLLALAPPSLKEVHLDGCVNVTTDGVIALFKKCVHLQVLDLSHCDHLVTVSLFESLSTLSHVSLTSVVMDQCDAVTDDVVQCLLRKFPNLKQLKLSCCRNITDSVFLVDKRRQSSLELSSMKPTFKSESDDVITTKFVCHLVSVDISGCCLTITCVRHLATLCGPTLRDVDISCSKMDPLAMWYLSGYSYPAAMRMWSRREKKKTSPTSLAQIEQKLKEINEKFEKFSNSSQSLVRECLPEFKGQRDFERDDSIGQDGEDSQSDLLSHKDKPDFDQSVPVLEMSEKEREVSGNQSSLPREDNVSGVDQSESSLSRRQEGQEDHCNCSLLLRDEDADQSECAFDTADVAFHPIRSRNTETESENVNDLTTTPKDAFPISISEDIKNSLVKQEERSNDKQHNCFGNLDNQCTSESKSLNQVPDNCGQKPVIDKCPDLVFPTPDGDTSVSSRSQCQVSDLVSPQEIKLDIKETEENTNTDLLPVATVKQKLLNQSQAVSQKAVSHIDQSENVFQNDRADLMISSDRRSNDQSLLPVHDPFSCTGQSDAVLEEGDVSQSDVLLQKCKTNSCDKEALQTAVTQSEAAFQSSDTDQSGEVLKESDITQSDDLLQAADINQPQSALHHDLLVSANNIFAFNEDMSIEPFHVSLRKIPDSGDFENLETERNKTKENLAISHDGVSELSVFKNRETSGTLNSKKNEEDERINVSQDSVLEVKTPGSDKISDVLIQKKREENEETINTSHDAVLDDIPSQSSEMCHSCDDANEKPERGEMLKSDFETGKEKGNLTDFDSLNLKENKEETNMASHDAVPKSTSSGNIPNCESVGKQTGRLLSKGDKSFKPRLKKMFSSNITSFSACHINITDTALDRVCLERFFTQNSNLLRLELMWKNLTNQALCYISKHLHNLRNLSLVDCNNVSDKLLNILGFHCQKIEKLDLKGVCFFEDDIPVPFLQNGCLRSLSLSESHITDKTLSLIQTSVSSRIVDLDFSWCEEITEDGVNCVAASCSSLRVLNFRHCPATDETLELLAENCRLLENLELSGVKDITDGAVMNLVSCLPLLKVIDISWNFALTNDSVVSLFRCCPLLEEAKLSGLKHLTSEAFTPIISDYPRWRRCQALFQFKNRERNLLKELGEEQYSSDEEYEALYLPHRSSVYAPSLEQLNLEYCNYIEDDKLQEIVGICRGSLTIIDYYCEKVTSSLRSLVQGSKQLVLMREIQNSDTDVSTGLENIDNVGCFEELENKADL